VLALIWRWLPDADSARADARFTHLKVATAWRHLARQNRQDAARGIDVLPQRPAG
jgi:hypothetical protein